jgi:RNA polymerase sigma factor (TIGR02999 family)
VTGLLLAWRAGDASALERLIPLVHAELRRIARNFMRKERAGHSLQTSALVNEAYLRLIDAHNVDWQNRAHFFAISASLMRRILVDFARARQKLKRGGPAQQVLLDEALIVTQARGTDLVALDDALRALSQLDPRQSKVVELRFFGGLTEEETAEVLGVTSRTVRSDWSMAKVWLLRELSKSGSGDER